jgi:hypothetical protein
LAGCAGDFEENPAESEVVTAVRIRTFIVGLIEPTPSSSIVQSSKDHRHAWSGGRRKWYRIHRVEVIVIMIVWIIDAHIAREVAGVSFCARLEWESSNLALDLGNLLLCGRN